MGEEREVKTDKEEEVDGEKKKGEGEEVGEKTEADEEK